MKILKPRHLANIIAEAADHVQAIDLKVLDLTKLTSFTDFFIICSGSSDTQVRAIADSILKELKSKGRNPLGMEGYSQGSWVLIDYGDCVIHIFYRDVRGYYNLEKLWIDAPRLPIPL